MFTCEPETLRVRVYRHFGVHKDGISGEILHEVRIGLEVSSFNNLGKKKKKGHETKTETL